MLPRMSYYTVRQGDVDHRYCKLSTTKRCDGPFHPTSGCTVVTRECMEEGLLAVRSFQMTNGQRPVIVMCGDRESHDYFRSQKIPLVEVLYREATKPDGVRELNQYHRADAIALKMLVLGLAVQKHGDSVFFDADLIHLERLVGPQDCEVALSLNLPSFVSQGEHSVNVGVFNAGLVWTCNPAFPSWWMHQYLSPEAKFYEQSGMNFAPAAFRCGYFALDHNYGFWRGDIGRRVPLSLHIHMGTKLDANMLSTEKWSMLEEVKRARREVWAFLHRPRHSALCSLARTILKHPRKLWFIHYGKCAGVYVNETMMRQIVPDYRKHDSWIVHKNRDWTPEELEQIISGSDDGEGHYLHQHHVNITEAQVALAKKRGWTTFTFVRNPAQTICALYYWDKRVYAETGKGIVLQTRNPISRMTLETFWDEMLCEENRYLWALPPYTAMIDSVREFSDEALADMCYRWFGYPHRPGSQANTAGNPGLRALRESGSVTESMIASLKMTPEYREYTKRFGDSL